MRYKIFIYLFIYLLTYELIYLFNFFPLSFSIIMLLLLLNFMPIIYTYYLYVYASSRMHECLRVENDSICPLTATK